MAKKSIVRLSKSSEFKLEYSAKIIMLEKLQHIEGTDALAVTVINGVPIVVNDKVVKEGDKMVYFCNETKINSAVLSGNSLFRDATMNADNTKTGFFEPNGRVKPIKLRGQVSFGFLTGIDFLAYTDRMKIDDSLIEVGTEFDSINDVRIVEAYIPEKIVHERRAKTKRSQRRLNNFERLIPNVFKLHYDTTPMGQAGNVLKNKDMISVTVKMHGTSGIFANILTLEPIKRNIFAKAYVAMNNWIVSKLGLAPEKKIATANRVYGNVYSSRTVIKNKYYNEKGDAKFPGGFYGTDIWSEVNEYIKPWLDEHRGVSVYGEIVGYCDDGQKEIQPNYDYGCDREGANAPKWKFMPYRFTFTKESGDVREADMREVIDLTKSIIAKCEDELNQAKGYVQVIPTLYYGRVKDLLKQAFNETFDECVENLTDKCVAAINVIDEFMMEKDEPLCRNKVAREGVVIRIDNDIVPRAFKLKCQKFLMKESEAISKGEWQDLEAEESIGE